MQLLKRLSFSRLRADRNVHQEMPSGQLSVAHQSAALKIWMKGRRIIRAWYSRLKKKKIYALMIISFILLETDSVITQAPLVVVVTRVPTPPPHFSCFQNNHKYVKVTLMVFANTRKRHRDVIRSKCGDEPYDSLRKGSWSPKQLIHGPSTWGTPNHTGNKAKIRSLAYKIIKKKKKKKTMEHPLFAFSLRATAGHKILNTSLKLLFVSTQGFLLCLL